MRSTSPTCMQESSSNKIAFPLPTLWPTELVWCNRGIPHRSCGTWTRDVQDSTTMSLTSISYDTHQMHWPTWTFKWLQHQLWGIQGTWQRPALFLSTRVLQQTCPSAWGQSSCPHWTGGGTWHPRMNHLCCLHNTKDMPHHLPPNKCHHHPWGHQREKIVHPRP